MKIHGSLEDCKFFAYYLDGDKVVAMSSIGRDPIVADFANHLYDGKSLAKADIEEDPLKWMQKRPKE